MGPCLLLLAALLAALRSRVLSQITVPLQLPPNTTGESGTLSYVLAIEGRPYTIHLQQHLFIPDDFRLYMSNEMESLKSDLTHIKGDCYYRGYIEGVPGSAVTLSTCSGLRGLLQFENASYGIEPLVNSPVFEHFIYQMSNENTAGFLFAKSRAESGARPAAQEMVLKIVHGEPALSAARSPKYFEVYTVLDKALYNYMGSDKKVATWKIIQIFNFVNNIFNPLNVTVVLSSLEFWIEENKISTAGEADELLQRFLERQQSYLALRSYDLACLFVYRDQASFAGATIPGKACQRDAAGAVAVYQRSVTLESFSVLLAQVLARSLGMSYDNNRGCRCPGHVCVMGSEALHVGGAKSFSSCSIGDFENFLERDAGDCLFDRPRLAGLSYRQAAVCGNGVVERGEQCDCGSAAACLKDKCCTKTCRFKPGVKCSSGLCCDGCQFKAKNSLCRPPADVQCDLAEYCNGSSASCPPDFYVQDGHDCEHGTGYCYKGRCQSADLQCRRLYGTGSKSAPVACYEELNSQRDRFGHCGFHPRQGYRACTWRNLRCGKLICTYPYSTPFATDAAAVLYVQVREHLCVSLDYLNVPARLDPLLIPPGTKCGSGKVCINNTCHPHSVLGAACISEAECHGHGVCDNRRRCRCHPGWKPPDCRRRGSPTGGGADGGPGPAERGSQIPLHITIPQRSPSKTAGETGTLSYVLAIEGRPYTIHLQQQFFLPDDFRIYTYNEKGSLYYDSPQIKGDCYYRGYIEGVPGSAVTLSTCSGLRGLLQFENASYGIEPLVNSPAFEHFIYQMSNESMADFLLAKSRAESGARPAVQEVSYKAHTALELLSKHHRELALHLILERNLYNYLGADKYVVTQKIVQIISSLSSMFSSLNMTITLSSMEVWMDKNKFQTGLNGEEVLMQLLKWKTTSAALRPYEVPYLLLYRDRASYAGATIPDKACQRDAAGAVAVYQRSVTLESFSVLLAQILARSLGMSYDNNRGCRCPRHVCVMGSEALRVSGAKSFSSCNAEDFENFLKQNPECPFIRVVQRGPLSRAAVCGNGVMEHGEQCDCGSVAACAVDKCCTSQCKLKPGVKCSSGRCCENCQFKAKNSLCRPPADVQCDLAEYCNGSSASCPPDFYVQDGHDCEHGTGYCYKGRCQSADLQCRRLYGTGAKNAPLACYEEVNSQQDRFGHCGNHPKDGYQPCSWLNLGCGKLVCTYPNHIPFTKVKGAIIYAQVQEHLCVSFDFMRGPTVQDPLLVKDGTKCGPRKVCVNGTCHPHSVLKYDCNVKTKCHGHGVCNNKKNCHCSPGWNPPQCKTRGSSIGGSINSGQQLRGHDDTVTKSFPKGTLKNWLLLVLCILIPILICCIILVKKWTQLMRRCARNRSQSDASEAGSLPSWESSTTEESGSEAGTEPEPGPEPPSERGPCRGGRRGQ
ncbi:disintegrin and metalloproteinase domain-containing protein 32-like isoform X4 [Anser cygnoides]|uniref:disintegrin and metalloproteinase domain-containing protein 32-like isoform X4 n=1 Tax=Anser cygnoides TaxID=8845 RepID=UPI0034D23CBF